MSEQVWLDALKAQLRGLVGDAELEALDLDTAPRLATQGLQKLRKDAGLVLSRGRAVGGEASRQATDAEVAAAVKEHSGEGVGRDETC